MKLKTRKSRGIALLLVIMIITLASTLVVNLTYSTYIGGRLNASLEQGLKGEYLVKSALSVARVLIRADKTDEDSPLDAWALFKHGLSIPVNWLGIDEPNVKIDLEITPVESKLPLAMLTTTLQVPPDKVYVDAFARLFNLLGFDDDKEEDQTGRFKGRVFNSGEMVANLIDYMDSDNESFDKYGYKGIESELPAGVFPNVKITRDAELASIPGFTPARVQKLLSYITPDARRPQVNINSASALVLEALHSDISKPLAEAAVSFRDGKTGPFDRSALSTQLSNLGWKQFSIDELSSKAMLTTKSALFMVIARAEFQASVTYLRAKIDTNLEKGTLPKVLSIELF